MFACHGGKLGSLLSWSRVLRFSILLVGPRAWGCFFSSVGEFVSRCRLQGYTAGILSEVRPCNHLPRKMPPTGHYVVALRCVVMRVVWWRWWLWWLWLRVAVGVVFVVVLCVVRGMLCVVVVVLAAVVLLLLLVEVEAAAQLSCHTL